MPTMYTTSPVIYSLAIVLSLSVIYLFAPQIVPPQSSQDLDLLEELDDLALFRRALKPAADSRRQVSHLATKNPTPKIAFLFLTNSDLKFAPLWERFFQGNTHLCNVYVHADPLSDVSVPGGIFKTQFIPSKRTQRSSPSLISAERRLIARAILDNPFNLYFALVSQHCIPLHSFRFVYSTLFGNNAFQAFASQSRHRSFIEILSEDPNLADRYNARGGEETMLPEVPFDKFRVGSQFFVLAKRHAKLVLEDKKLWRKFRLPCLNPYSCYPEEHYFPTLLSMADPKGCSHHTLTHVNWTGRFDGHPYLYQPREISPDLVIRLRKSNSNSNSSSTSSSSSSSYLFARKFSPDCLQPLMDIADDVIFKD